MGTTNQAGMFTRRVRVDRTRRAEEVLSAHGRMVNGSLLPLTMELPRGVGEEVEVVFFPCPMGGLAVLMSDDFLQQEYERLSLIPADIYSLAAVNEADPTFSGHHPNGTHWKNERGEWCYALFYEGYEGCISVEVDVHDVGDDWVDGGGTDDSPLPDARSCWFAGIRKQGQPTLTLGEMGIRPM